MSGKSHATEFRRKRTQNSALDPVVDADKMTFPAAADHRDEDRDHTGDNHHDESVTGEIGIRDPGDRRRDRTQRNCVSGDQCGRPATASRARQQRTRGQQAQKT